MLQFHFISSKVIQKIDMGR